MDEIKVTSTIKIDNELLKDVLQFETDLSEAHINEILQYLYDEKTNSPKQGEEIVEQVGLNNIKSYKDLKKWCKGRFKVHDGYDLIPKWTTPEDFCEAINWLDTTREVYNECFIEALAQTAYTNCSYVFSADNWNEQAIEILINTEYDKQN